MADDEPHPDGQHLLFEFKLDDDRKNYSTITHINSVYNIVRHDDTPDGATTIAVQVHKDLFLTGTTRHPAFLKAHTARRDEILSIVAGFRCLKFVPYSQDNHDGFLNMDYILQWHPRSMRAMARLRTGITEVIIHALPMEIRELLPLSETLAPEATVKRMRAAEPNPFGGGRRPFGCGRRPGDCTDDELIALLKMLSKDKSHP